MLCTGSTNVTFSLTHTYTCDKGKMNDEKKTLQRGLLYVLQVWAEGWERHEAIEDGCIRLCLQFVSGIKACVGGGQPPLLTHLSAALSPGCGHTEGSVEQATPNRARCWPGIFRCLLPAQPCFGMTLSSADPSPGQVRARLDSVLGLIPKDVADQLCCFHQKTFNRLRPSELVHTTWNSLEKERTAPNVLKIFSQFNKYAGERKDGEESLTICADWDRSFCVRYLCPEAPLAPAQSGSCGGWTLLTCVLCCSLLALPESHRQHLATMGDLHGNMSIASALQMSCIDRLKQTQAVSLSVSALWRLLC